MGPGGCQILELISSEPDQNRLGGDVSKLPFCSRFCPAAGATAMPAAHSDVLRHKSFLPMAELPAERLIRRDNEEKEEPLSKDSITG
jgi:hypothetical protein